MFEIKKQYLKNLFIYILVLINGAGLFSNNLPAMVNEVIDIQITELPDPGNFTNIKNYQARVTGSYLFNQEKPGKNMMLYPVPVNSKNISVKVNGTSCSIEQLEYIWNTRLGGYPAFAFKTDPDSLPFELEVCYTHDIPQDENTLNTFLYPIIFNRKLGDTTETSISFNVTIPKEITFFKTCLGDTEIAPDIQYGDKTIKLSYAFVNNNPQYTMDFIVSFSSGLKSEEKGLKNLVKKIKSTGTNIIFVIKRFTLFFKNRLPSH